MSEEIWKPIINFEGRYEVSNHGRVKSLRRIDCNNRPLPEIYLKFSYDKDGYIKIVLSKDGAKKRYSMHRLVSLHFIPNIENKPQTNHKDGIKTNNHYSNLEWATASENVRHGFRSLGRDTHGIKNSRAKLSEEQVLEIKRLKIKGMSVKNISIHLNLNIKTVGNIYYNKQWKHLTP